MLSLSTFNFKRRSKWHFFTGSVALCGLLWLLFYAVSWPLAGWVEAKFGARLLALGDGKFDSAATFVHHRLQDGLTLFSATLLLAAAGWIVFTSAVVRRVSRAWRWVPISLCLFAGVNALGVLGAHTGLFWIAMWEGKADSHDFTSFSLKRRLLIEHPAPRKAAVLGTSQVNRAIIEQLLDRELGNRMHTADLYMPGTRPFALLLMQRLLAPAQADLVICYVSEWDFYKTISGRLFPFFMGPGGMNDFFALGGGGHFWDDASLRQGLFLSLVGQALPIFRLRDVLTQRVIGHEACNVDEKRWKRRRPRGLGERAKSFMARHFGPVPPLEFRQRAVDEFVARCAKTETQVVFCLGQTHPEVMARMPPKWRTETRRFLAGLEARYSNVIFMDEPDIPVFSADDFDDLTHLNDAAGERFTKNLARQLEKRVDFLRNAAGSTRKP